MPPALRDALALAGRLSLALIFVFEGWVKLGQYQGTVGYMEGYGVPGGCCRR